MNKPLVLLLVIVALYSIGGSASTVIEDCTAWSLQTCTACLSTTATCGWCKSTGACLSNVDALQCPNSATNWIYPIGSVVYNNVNSALAPTFAPPVSTSDGILTPKNATIALRPGREFSISITVKPVNNIPVDFYFLIDANSGMYSDIFTLKSLQNDIKTWLQSLTYDIRVGLGSFGDKPIQPFTDPTVSWPPDYINTFNVRHHLNLTSDLNAWGSALDSLKVAADFDAPHSGLEAITQIASCSNIIGWRNDTRKVLFVLTNEGYHLRMDGIRARIEGPFSSACALTKQTTDFTASLTNQDYPSMDDFISFFSKQGIVPIFGIPASRPHLAWAYGAPNGIIGKLGYGTVVQLEDRSSDILLRLQQGYDAIANTIYMVDTTSSGYLTKSKSASLLDVTGTKIANSASVSVTFKTNTRILTPVTISLVAVGQPMSFPVRITDESYPTCTSKCVEATCAGNCNGIGACDCGRCVNCTGNFGGVDCVSAITTNCPDTGGNICNGHGTCEGYGRCVCDEGWQHDSIGGTIRTGSCSCSTSACPSDSNGLICSNHGSCRCGTCTCDSGYSGFDCSCQTAATCSSDCGGPQRGSCNCGTCECVFPWYGPSCSYCTPGAQGCPLSTASICETFNNDCGACVSHSDSFNTTCFWCSDVQACIPAGNEQTCQQVITYSLLGDCPCLNDCENDIFLTYSASSASAFSFVKKADTDVGPIIGLTFACVVAMGLVVLALAKIYVEQQMNNEWKRYFTLRSQLQKSKGTKETSNLLNNKLYSDKDKKKKKKKKKEDSDGDEDDAPKKRKKEVEPKKKKKPKKAESDDEDDDY